MKIFLQENLYVNNICENFQGEKIYTKKDIQSLSTCVIEWDNTTIANFDIHIGRF